MKRSAPKPTPDCVIEILPLPVWKNAVPPTVSGPALPMLPSAELAVRLPLTDEVVLAAPSTRFEPRLPRTEMVTLRALNTIPAFERTSEVGSSRMMLPFVAASVTTPLPGLGDKPPTPAAPPRRTPPKPVSIMSPFTLEAVKVPLPPPGTVTERRFMVALSVTAMTPAALVVVRDNGPKLLAVFVNVMLFEAVKLLNPKILSGPLCPMLFAVIASEFADIAPSVRLPEVTSWAL